MNMKTIIKYLCVLITGALLFTACNHQLSYKAQKTADGKILVRFAPSYDSVYSSTTNERTAIPTVNFENYVYDLDYVEGYGTLDLKDQANAFTNQPYTGLNKAVAFNPNNYQFILTAKKDGVPVLRGEAIANISENSGNITFMMYPVTGSTGEALITVWFPLHGPIAKVTASVSDSIFGSDNLEELTISHVSGEACVRYKPTNLPSGGTLFASLKFYDQAGQLLYEMIESIQVVGGCTSISPEVRLIDEDWHSYPVVVRLKKDGELWNGTGKNLQLKLKSDSTRSYTLQETSQGYTASVGEGIYYVYIDDENTGVELASVNKTIDLEYNTVSLTNSTIGCKLVPESVVLDPTDTSAVVLKGSTFVYKLSLLPGYEPVSSGIVVKENNNVKSGYKLETEYQVLNLSSSLKIDVAGIKPIEYTITYSWGSDAGVDGAVFVDEASVPRVYTAQTVVELPQMKDVKRNGYFFDAWVLKNNSSVVVNTTEGFAQNLELVATWKEGVYVDVTNKKIYANGINLIIEKNSKTGATNVFVDMNGNSVKNEEDTQVKASDDSDDFTGYSLYAGSSTGKIPNSNFTFTMTGGTLRGVYGLGKDLPNKSVLKLSGDSKIGSAVNQTPVKDSSGNMQFFYEQVEGVMLNTFTNELVTISNQLTPESRIILISDYEYIKGINRYLTTEILKDWINYSNFICYADLTKRTVEPEAENSPKRYLQNILTMYNRIVGGVQQSQVRLAPTSGVDFPSAGEITAAGGDFVNGFSLGTNKVVSECSVFSIIVENGVFWVNERTTFTNNTTSVEKEIESALEYMVQPTSITYEENIKFKKSDGTPQTYVYMHVISSYEKNQISSETASDFLAQLSFKKTDQTKPMTIRVNLETVPTEQIKEMNVIYFDGSFYKSIPAKEWRLSYNEAKSLIFNNLHGYLANITSEVENNYLYEYLGKKSGGKSTAWIGGTRVNNVINGSVVYDAPSYASTGSSSTNLSTGWYWRSGPEAGVCFWKTTKFETIDSRMPIDPNDVSKGYWYQKWDNSKTLGTGFGGEPNNSNGEPCIQYLSGQVDGKEKSGTWNDIANTKVGTGTYEANYAFVEFTPYENNWNKEDALYLPLKSQVTY